jgi:hypothetical protein
MRISSRSSAAKINMAWEHGGADFRSRLDKPTAQAEQMKSEAAAGFMMDKRFLSSDLLNLCNPLELPISSQ